MRKLLIAMAIGLVTTIAWLPAAFFISGTFHWLAWMNLLAFSPADFVKRRILSPGAVGFVFGLESQGGHHKLLLLLAICFWWLVFSIAAWFTIQLATGNRSRLS